MLLKVLLDDVDILDLEVDGRLYFRYNKILAMIQNIQF
jgi:hypothetical protein